MDDIFKPLLSGTSPSPPKFNVNVTWSALAPMDERNQTPITPLVVTRALKHWDFGVRGFNTVSVAGFEYFVHLLSRSLMFSHLFVSKLCCGNITLPAADLIPNCTAHCLFKNKCLLSCLSPSHSFLFPNSQLIPSCMSSQVSATCVLPVPLCPIFPLNSQLSPNCKNTLFSQVKAACVSLYFPTP